ncbi:MAG: MFS transporter [bacterium]|nr:MFS transporter [bacterium]
MLSSTQASRLQRNIWLIYITAALQSAWFWVPIWVLFYLRFTDYAGIGLLESIMIISVTLSEIPTGAVADLLGKRKTLILGFFLFAVGNVLMGFAPSFAVVVAAVIIITVGGSFASGTVEALVYDSLLSLGKEKTYDKVISTITSVRLVALSLASVVGGALYTVSPGLPFLLVGLTGFCAVLCAFWLVEPPVETVKFSFKNYIKQTKTGFSQLFKTRAVGWQSLVFLILTAIVVMNDQMLIDIQIVEQGWLEQQLGLVFAALFLIGAGFSQLTHRLHTWLGSRTAFVVSAMIFAVTMICIPLFGIWVATAIIIVRAGLSELLGNTTSVVINADTESKYRATTLSTFNMLSGVPYIFSGYFIGKFMVLYTVDTITAYLGLGMVALALAGFFILRRNV